MASDPHALDNLAGSSEHESVLKRLRLELRAFCSSIEDAEALAVLPKE